MHFDLQRILRVNHFSHDKHTALQAKQEAQRIAFGPFIFQAAKAMRDLGVLSGVETAGDEGLALDAIEARNGDRDLWAKSVQSDAEDLDMVQAVSDFSNKQTSYQAALQSYAMVQRMSLFDYLK